MLTVKFESSFFRALALLGAGLWASVGWAQVQVGEQIRLDTGGTAAANEISVAASNFNPNEVVVTWNDWRESPVPNPTRAQEVFGLGAAVSNDGGENWTDDLVRPPPSIQTNNQGDPMTAYDDRTGTLWVGAVAYGSPETLYVARKNPGETTFVLLEGIPDAEERLDKPWMAAGPAWDNPNATTLYIAYEKTHGSSSVPGGFVVASTNMGESWEEPIWVGVYGQGFLPRVGPDGVLYVIYHDPLPPNNDKVLLIQSSNGGGAFGAPESIATRKIPWGVEHSERFPGDFTLLLHKVHRSECRFS